MLFVFKLVPVFAFTEHNDLNLALIVPEALEEAWLKSLLRRFGV